MADRGEPAPPLALDATSVAPRARSSSYPEPFFSRMSGREKRALGDAFGLRAGLIVLFVPLAYLLGIGFWARPLITNKTI